MLWNGYIDPLGVEIASKKKKKLKSHFNNNKKRQATDESLEIKACKQSQI